MSRRFLFELHHDLHSFNNNNKKKDETLATRCSVGETILAITPRQKKKIELEILLMKIDDHGNTRDEEKIKHSQSR